MLIRTAPTGISRVSSLAGMLARAAAGEPLGRDDACALGHLAEDALGPVLAAAARLRTAAHGDVITYSPKVFLPLTNLCRDHCSYCTFRKDPSEAGAWTMTRAEVRSSVRNGHAAGCTEALFCVGDRPELAFRSYRATLRAFGHPSTVAYAREACQIALEAGLLPHSNLGVLTREEMVALRPFNASLGLMLENVSPRLREKGMAHHGAPDKDPKVRLEMLAAAGGLAIPVTTGILLGIGETWEERIDSLIAIRELHARYGHIQEVIVQNFRAKPETRMAAFPEPGAADTARTIAVARLLLGPGMNLQAPPNLSPADHRLLIEAGINDWGGISPVTRDYVNPEAAWPAVTSLGRICDEAGFRLVPRLCVYPEFIAEKWIDRSLLPRVEEMETARLLCCGDGAAPRVRQANAAAH